MENLDKVVELREKLHTKNYNIQHKGGVYCWWFKKEAAERLISVLSLSEDEKTRIQRRTIDDHEYWALYFGISSDMLERAKWHIIQHHSESTVKYGTLSTLRKTISALLGVHISKSEDKVNGFLDKYCYWEWEYDDNYKQRETNELSSRNRCYPLNIQENKTIRKNVIDKLKSLRCKCSCTPSTIINIIDTIIPVLKHESGVGNSDSFSYVQQRAMINQIFASTSGDNYNVQSIMLRLIVIDSLYSTNAAYSYFSFEEMAKKIFDLGKNETKVAEYFYSITNGENDEKELFSSNYGIRKNLVEGSKQMSLMSKYAYYVLLQHPNEYKLGFPIYDSLAIEMYPKVCSLLGQDPKFTESKANNDKITIKEYITALNNLRSNIFGNDELYKEYQQYDLLDAYLWRMGKLNKGNYSLLFSRNDYEKFIENIELDKQEEDELFRRFPTLVSEKVEKTKTGKESKSYKYDFNTLVKEQCSKLELDIILKGIETDNLKVMISHWREFYL